MTELICIALVVISLASLLFWLRYRSGMFASDTQSAELDAAEREFSRRK